MLTRKGSLLIAAMAAIVSLFSVVYVSCTKVGDRPACNGLICQNSGYCKNGRCKCPAGYEGTTCGTKSVARYYGTWDVHQTTVGSDSASVIGIDSSYTVFLQATATPTTFFIDNFLGNASYNDLLCTMDTLNTHWFGLDSLRDFNMWYEHVYIRPGSAGILADNDSIINAQVIIRRLSASFNWRIDTLQMVMTKHHF